MPRVPDRLVWFIWSSAFVVAWAGFFAAVPRLRNVMWRVSICTAPLGLTEALFVGRYWNPPSLFNLARAIHCDIESFLFCFGIGGVAAVLYNAVTARPVLIPSKQAAQARRQQFYIFAFLAPFLAYLPLLVWLDRPLWAGIIVLFAGAGARVAMFPGLRVKTLVGGVLFLIYYLAFLAVLSLLSAGYVSRVWVREIPGGRTFGIPRAEFAFALGVGLFWSGVYEQVIWIFARPGPGQEERGLKK